MTGKPYSGKPTVRFDEGELEIELSATTPALYSTKLNTRVLYFFARGQRMIAVHGIRSKSQRISERGINVALERKKTGGKEKHDEEEN